jgi:hypothetical protein
LSLSSRFLVKSWSASDYDCIYGFSDNSSLIFSYISPLSVLFFLD